MRVLWISPNGANYKNQSNSGSGGWIPSLQKFLEEQNEIELGVVFTHTEDEVSLIENKTTYFPILNRPKSVIKKLVDRYTDNGEKDEYRILKNISNIIDEFKPNIIHIWGIEHYYCKILNMTNIPCIIHIQGLANSILNANFPPNFCAEDLVKLDGFINSKILRRGYYNVYKELGRKAKHESEIANDVKYWMGRTDWDRETISVISPTATYFHCDEVMRDDFFVKQWRYKETPKIIIHTTVGEALYKGVDVILKSAKLLKTLGIDFEWTVCGMASQSKLLKLIESKTGLKHKDCNVEFYGNVAPSKLCELLLSADVYVHTSYIESGSNAISEAQLLGVPVIAQYIGGLPTTLKNGAGILVQANDPWLIVSAIKKIKLKEIAEEISKNCKQAARERNDGKKVATRVLEIYKLICN